MSDAVTTSFSAWSTGRKVAAMSFSAGCLAILTCMTLYLSGVLFLILNKANPARVHLTSITRYWQLYGDDPPLRRKLQIAIGASAGGLLVLLPASMLAAARPRRSLHGAARFATRAEVARAGLLTGEQPGILVGKHRGRFLSLPGQLSVMLSAPTRSGKGVGVVIPNLLNWPDSVVVLDIKGENFDITAGFRAAQGQPVYAFSPFDDEARSHRWNPLSAVRTSPRHRIGDLLNIGQMLYPNDGGATHSEAFFNDQARNFFLALGLMLLETPELPRSIGEMLRQASGKGRPLRKHIEHLVTMRDASERPFSAECKDALQRLTTTSQDTLSSIVATFVAPLTIFTDAVVDAATSADDFRLEDLRRDRMSIYVRIPPSRLADARPLLNLFCSQLVSLNTQHLPQQDPTLKFQCLLVNDEFATMGRVGAIINTAAFLAGYNLRLLTVVQAMSQLDSAYGEKDARTFATNHGLQILYAPREQRDADEYSAMLGQFTERATSHGRSQSFSAHGHSSISSNESAQRRSLLLPQEFKELGSERLVIILENCKPILGEKIRYHRDKAFKSRLLTPPVLPTMDVEGHRARIQEQWRLVEASQAAGDEGGGTEQPEDARRFSGAPESSSDRLDAALRDAFAEKPDSEAAKDDTEAEAEKDDSLGAGRSQSQSQSQSQSRSRRNGKP
ncbi:MAG: type IV secretory system conjugative DNA transfer family protein [Burkholderiales bacterium]|nr:type IV secretory system conjugative DNA transfer family protein [Burkholderiales bacterium]